MCLIKAPTKDLEDIFIELNDIFLNKRHLKSNDIKHLEKLGFQYKHTGGHPKIYINLDNVSYCVTLSTSASDKNTGRQVIREIRRIYINHMMQKKGENYGTKNKL